MKATTHVSENIRHILVNLSRIFLSVMIAVGFLGVQTPNVHAEGDAILSGVITDSGGTGVEGVWVYANDYATDAGAGGASTDVNGAYSFTVPAGSYRVRACPSCSGLGSSYANQYAGGTPIRDNAAEVIVQTGETYTQNFSLQPGGSISGMVNNQHSQPVEGMTIAVLNDSQQWVDATNTMADGTYTIDGIPYGTYRVYACAECNTSTSTYINQYYDGAASFDAATLKTVNEGSNPSGVNFSLTDGNTLEGRVTDTQSTPAPLAGVQVAAVQWDASTSQWNWIRIVETDPDGYYQIAGLPDGTYRVQACPECSNLMYLGEYYNDRRNVDDAENIALSNGETRSEINFALDSAGVIQGNVIGPDGNPLANVPVRAENVVVDGPDFDTWADADGNYTLYVSEGSYIVHTQLNWNDAFNYNNVVDEYYNQAANADGATPVPVNLQQVVSGINFSLSVGNTILGRVTDSAETPSGLEGITVAAIQWETGNWIKSVQTASNGSYTLTGLPDGQYRIQACPECSQKYYLSKYYENTPYYDQATPLSLSRAGLTTGINFTLDAAGVISGKITSSDGTPLPNIPLFVENTQTGEGFGAWSDENGNYAIYTQPGYYRLRTHVVENSDLNDMNYVDQIYQNAPNFEESTVIETNVNQTSAGYDFVLQQGGSITGTIKDTAGDPLENATVLAVAADGSRFSYGSQPTGADGVFTLSGLPAGDYKLRAMHEGSQAQYYPNADNWSDATAVSVLGGNPTENIDFQLPAETGEDPALLTMRQSTIMPDMYDPGWTDYAHNGYLVDQIFAGMTRIDPANELTLNDLAQGWTSSENLEEKTEVWTFTLRDGLKWSDGSPLTAADIRYALLRDLKMDKNADIVYNMMIIQGAEAYNQGTVGAAQVGVTLDGTDPEHVIHFTLTTPTVFFPTMMSTMPVRPIPQMLAQAFPDNWLEPDKLITSGPYRLVEFDGNHVLLKKNANFIDQASVQIQQVVIQNIPQNEVYGKYLSGELDTATIPGGAMNAANTDPDVKAELKLIPQQCTTFYGFNVQTLPDGYKPVNEILLRKALIEAIDRDAYTAAMGGGITTAWTFIAPGVIGHSDKSAGINLNYDEAQALIDINAAYGGNYNGLPQITLYYPSDALNASVQKAEVEYLANAWNQLLNTHFVVEGISISDYTDRIINGEMFAFRRGWCTDYIEGYNFLSFLSSSPIFQGWNVDDKNEFNADLDRALKEADPNTRALDYQQAETIALKTDAILMPLYYGVNPILSRGFVRSFGVGGSDYIADWTLDRTDEQVIGGQVGSLSTQAESTVFSPAGEGGAVTYTVPDGAFPSGTNLIHTGNLTYNLTNLPDGKTKTSLYFTFVAEDAGNHPVTAAADYTLTVHYAQAEVEASHLMENTLALYYWDSANGRWVKDSNSQVDAATNTITTHSQHQGDWLVMGTEGTNHVFIPLVVR